MYAQINSTNKNNNYYNNNNKTTVNSVKACKNIHDCVVSQELILRGAKGATRWSNEGGTVGTEERFPRPRLLRSHGGAGFHGDPLREFFFYYKLSARLFAVVPVVVQKGELSVDRKLSKGTNGYDLYSPGS